MKSGQLSFGIGPQVPAFKYFRLRRLPPGPRIVKVVCQRCGGWVILDAVEWKQASQYATRPCTHCFKVSAIQESRDVEST